MIILWNYYSTANKYDFNKTTHLAAAWFPKTKKWVLFKNKVMLLGFKNNEGIFYSILTLKAFCWKVLRTKLWNHQEQILVIWTQCIITIISLFVYSSIQTDCIVISHTHTVILSYIDSVKNNNTVYQDINVMFKHNNE